jgi:hypothetical protein
MVLRVHVGTAEGACAGVGIEVRLLVEHVVGLTVGVKVGTAEAACVGVGIEAFRRINGKSKGKNGRSGMCRRRHRS